MSSQRVIQDSDDDEIGDDCSDVATSIDPLQDPSLLYDAPSTSNERARPAEHGAELIPTSIPESNLPQVDFDRYLRSESSIMAGDYEDERWVSTADAAPAGAPQPNREYYDQRQDDIFVYPANSGYVVPDTLPSTADMGRSEPQQLGHVEGTDGHEHPSKRRKISLTQDTLQENLSGGTSGVGVSYDFFASIDPHSPSQAATELRTSIDLPRQAQQEGSEELVLERFETPPPTVPLSEDVLYDQDRAKNEPLPTTINESEAEITCDQGPAFETDNEVLGSKKKRGRPKKQALADKTEDQVEFVSDGIIAPVNQTNKKKLGRPKKQDRDTSPDELAMDQMMKHQTDDVRGQKAISKPDKPKKKKVKRSKTTSDLPNPTSLPNDDRDMRWIDNSLVIDLENTESNPTGVDETTAVPVSKEELPTKKATGDENSATNDTKAEPKKRGRKKKSTTEGPPAAYVESSSVLQDISNTAHLSTKDEHNPNGDQTGGSKPNEISETEHPQKGMEATAPAAETPMKSESTAAKADGESPATVKQAPAKPSPILNTGKVPYRVGLSRRARIAPLLKIVRK